MLCVFIHFFFFFFSFIPEYQSGVLIDGFPRTKGQAEVTNPFSLSTLPPVSSPIFFFCCCSSTCISCLYILYICVYIYISVWKNYMIKWSLFVIIIVTLRIFINFHVLFFILSVYISIKQNQLNDNYIEVYKQWMCMTWWWNCVYI